MTRRRHAWLLIVTLGGVSCAGSNDVAVERSTSNSTVAPSAPVSQAPTTDGAVPDESATTLPPVTPTTPTTSGAPGTSPVPAVDADGVGSDGVGDSFYPDLGNGGYDVVHYELDIAVDAESNTIDATTTIEAVATSDLTQFDLDLHELDVASIAVDGVTAEYERVADELQIRPADPLRADAEFTVEVAYSGQPEPVEDPGVPFDSVGWHARNDVIYVASEPSGAMSWFPNNNHPTDKATFGFVITTDASLTVVANGVETGRIDNGDGTATTTWEMDDPMTTYLASVYIGDFERRDSVTNDGLVIRNFFPPELADDLEDDFAITADVIGFYAELLDTPYPFDEYGSIVLPFDVGFALENQTISVHGLDAVDAETIAHEIVHQWLGNSVTVADWQDIWMNEGFASYLTYLYFEDRGVSPSLSPSVMYQALGGSSDGPAEVPIEELFGISVYLRGALALHALRVDVGDDVFRTILRTHYAAHAGGDVTTDEFLAVVDDIVGRSAVDVLESWLFGTELPPFPE